MVIKNHLGRKREKINESLSLFFLLFFFLLGDCFSRCVYIVLRESLWRIP